MRIKRNKTSNPKVQGLRGGPVAPAKKFRFPEKTPFITTKKRM